MHSPISIVVPIYNEEDCVQQLCDTVIARCEQIGLTFELIVVDDGSRDQSAMILRRIANAEPRVRALILQRNFGQTAALSAGIDHARHEIIVTMDGDLQNDPADIPLLLDKLENGAYDVISGWRRNRKDKLVSRKIPSMLANRLIGKVTGVRLHDYGCSLKAYRASILRRVRLYGELHRFIPALCAVYGARVTEIPVSHHARTTGKSKYGIGRTFRVILDLLTVKFLLSYGTRPLHFFGTCAAFFIVVGFLCLVTSIAMKFGQHGISINRNPIFYVSVLMGVGAVQMISIGLLAELIMRTYYESQGKPTYAVREIIGQDDGSAKAALSPRSEFAAR